MKKRAVLLASVVLFAAAAFVWSQTDEEVEAHRQALDLTGAYTNDGFKLRDGHWIGALARGKGGEHIRDINKGFPHWFCDNYKRFDDREAELPVDQHMLAALIAPRLLYIASASEDSWADPKSEFLSGVHASPVFRLFGLEG